MASPSYVASEDIATSVFVNVLSGSDHKIEVCDAGDLAIGISHEGPQAAVLPGGSVGPAAVSGSSTRIYGMGESCMLKAGAAVSAGAFLKPDNTGRGVTAGAGEEYSAFCRAGAENANELLQVTIEMGIVPA